MIRNMGMVGRGALVEGRIVAPSLRGPTYFILIRDITRVSKFGGLCLL